MSDRVDDPDAWIDNLIHEAVDNVSPDASVEHSGCYCKKSLVLVEKRRLLRCRECGQYHDPYDFVKTRFHYFQNLHYMAHELREKIGKNTELLRQIKSRVQYWRRKERECESKAEVRE